MSSNYDVNEIRNMIEGINIKVPLLTGEYITSVNFDNAATTPPLKSVISAINDFAPYYSSIHRGSGYKSTLTTELYDNSRNIIGQFVGADMKNDIVIYVKNTTEAINKLANRLCIDKNRPMMLTTIMEHHSNLLPWKKRFDVSYIPTDKNGRLSLADLKRILLKNKGRIKLVAVTGASNVTGLKNPIYEIAALCHKHGARIVVDGAQLVPHSSFDMLPSDHQSHIDFLAFSSHKLYSPFGIGVLIGPKHDFECGCPDYSGGGTVKYVTNDYVGWDNPPAKEEAGTPNVMGVIALTAAISNLSDIGMNHIEAYETELVNYGISKLIDLSDVNIYSFGKQLNNLVDRIGIIPFNIKDLNYDAVAMALSMEYGIAVRSGCFCAHPYVQKLLNINRKQIQYHIKHPEAKKPGMVRISFGMYNTKNEIDLLAKCLKEISKYKDCIKKRYENFYILK